MFHWLNNQILYILILLSFIFTCVYGSTCSVFQTTCYYNSLTWCCPDDWYCGDTYGSCTYHRTTTPSSLPFPTSVLVVLITVPSVFIIACIIFCICAQQRQPRSHTPMNNQIVTLPYQQQPVRVVHVRPVYNVGNAPNVHQVYEAPPPSYEDATANLISKHQPTSSSQTTIVEQTDSRF